MRKLVSNADQALENIRRLSSELAKTPELADRVSMAHAWYIDARDPDYPVFGFSKFIGYKALTGAKYLKLTGKKRKNNDEGLDGRNTEWALKKFSEELREGSRQYKAYHNKLTDWLAEFGKTPRKNVRLLILRPDPEHVDETKDRRLLELLTAVIDFLPLDQRLELRSRI